MRSLNTLCVWFLPLAATLNAVAADGGSPLARVSFPSFGLSAVPPAGHLRVNEAAFEQAAAWIATDQPRGSSGNNSIIQLMVIAAEGRGIDTMLEELTTSLGARPEETGLKLGRQPTHRFDFVGETGQALTTLVCAGGKVFVMAVHTRTGDPATHAREFRDFAASVRISDPEPPKLNLTVRDFPTPLAGTEVVFQPLAPLRLLERDEDNKMTEFGIQDYSADKSEFHLSTYVVRRPADEAFDQTVGRFCSSIADALDTKKEITATDVKAPIKVAMTGLLWQDRERSGGGSKRLASVYVFADDTPDAVVMLQCEIYTSKKSLGRAYLKAIREMAGTLRSSPEYHEGRSLSPD